MIYVTSDIHGEYQKYKDLLKQINLGEKDALIILGDVVDRGPESMELLFDIMDRKNVFLYMGNHEQIALGCLKTMNKEITKESISSLDAATIEMLSEWIGNLGGQPTLDGFRELSIEQRQEVLDFLEDLPTYEEITINNQDYLLVHGGLKDFHPDKPIDDYLEDDLLWERIDYGMKYYDDKIIITGHTPTVAIDDNPNPYMIYKENNHLGVDCGCSFPDGQLGCICLDTGKEYYVK